MGYDDRELGSFRRHKASREQYGVGSTCTAADRNRIWGEARPWILVVWVWVQSILKVRNPGPGVKKYDGRIRNTGTQGVSEYKTWLGVWLRLGTDKGRCNQLPVHLGRCCIYHHLPPGLGIAPRYSPRPAPALALFNNCTGDSFMDQACHYQPGTSERRSLVPTKIFPRTLKS